MLIKRIAFIDYNNAQLVEEELDADHLSEGERMAFSDIEVVTE